MPRLQAAWGAQRLPGTRWQCEAVPHRGREPRRDLHDERREREGSDPEGRAAVERDGLRCVSAANGITCTLLAGAGKGKGFRINAEGVVEVP